jgi:putative DNA primase/helicase
MSGYSEPAPDATPDAGRVYLAVPFAEKNDAKALGARWDAGVRAWFAPPGADLALFGAWLPARAAEVATGPDPRQAFGDALRAAGLRLDGAPVMDGHLHRVRADGDRGAERSGAYVGHLDGHPAGFVQNFRTGLRETWRASREAATLAAQDRAQLAAEAAQHRHDRAIERERAYEHAAEAAAAAWTAARPAGPHPYLAAKGIAAHGLRQDEAGRLLVPIRDADGKLWSLQRIDRDGFKAFHEGGRVQGGHHVIGDIEQSGPLLIAEGYATAATLHDLTGAPVLVAFHAGNLASVAAAYRARFPDRAIYLAGDNDHRREAEGAPNVGREKAEAAAAAIGGVTLLPRFAAQDAGSDWNDAVRTQGREAARMQILIGLAISEREQMTRSFAAARDAGAQEQVRAPDRDATRAEAHALELER